MTYRLNPLRNRGGAKVGVSSQLCRSVPGSHRIRVKPSKRYILDDARLHLIVCDWVMGGDLSAQALYRICGEREGRKILEKLRQKRYVRSAPVSVSAERRPTTSRIYGYKVTNQRAVSPRLLTASGLRKDTIPLAFDDFSGLYFSNGSEDGENEVQEAPTCGSWW